ERIKTAKNSLKIDQTQLSEQKTLLKNRKEQRGGLAKDVNDKNAALSKREEKFAIAYETVVSIEESNWEAKLEALKIKSIKLERCIEIREKYQQIVERANPAFEELLKICEDGKEAADEIKSLYKREDLLKDYQHLQASWKETLQNLD